MPEVPVSDGDGANVGAPEDVFTQESLFGDDVPGEPEKEPGPQPDTEPSEPEDLPEDADGDEGESDDSGSEEGVEIEGVGRFTAEQIRELKAAAQELETIKGSGLDSWKRLNDLADTYPAFREKIVALIGELEQDPSKLGDPIEKESTDPATRDREQFIDHLMVEKATQEIESLVKDYSERFPDVVTGGQKWVREVLAPAVEERFGANVGLKEIRMTLSDMVVSKSGVQAAQKRATQSLTEKLSGQPKGTAVVKGPGTRAAAKAPEKDWSGESMDAILESIAQESFRKE